MAIPRLGRGLAFGFAKETTWATPVSRTNWVRGVNSGLTMRHRKAPRPDLYGASTGTRIKHFDEAVEAGGPIEWLFGFEGQGPLFEAALWATPSTSGPVSSIYTHTYALGAAAPTGLTIEEVRGTDPTTNNARVYAGCKLDSIEWSCSAGGVIKCSAGVLGQKHAGSTSAGTPTFTTNEVEGLHHAASTLAWDGATYSLVSWKATVANHQGRRMNLGSKYTQEPAPSDFREVSFEVEIETTTDALLTAHIADTEGDAVLSFTGTGSRTATWTLQNAYVDSVEDSIGGPGVIIQRVRFVGQSDGTDHGLKLVIANSQSSALAA
jgi:hypothetical protein